MDYIFGFNLEIWWYVCLGRHLYRSEHITIEVTVINPFV